MPTRKQTPEPVFGIIKSVMGFRFSAALARLSAASGASSPWLGTSSGCMHSGSAERYQRTTRSRDRGDLISLLPVPLMAARRREEDFDRQN